MSHSFSNSNSSNNDQTPSDLHQNPSSSTKRSSVRGPDKKPRKSKPDHGFYIYGKGKSRDYDPRWYTAWKEGVLQKYAFRCFLTEETDDLECHH